MFLTPNLTALRPLLLTLCCTLAFVPAARSQRKETTDPDNPSSRPEATDKAIPLERAKKDDAVELSPFAVTTDKDAGYFAENTLAGSRLNTKLSDLAASITVVTKQQIEDTGSLDLNDVFRYEASTEGSSTYTPSVQAARNDGVADTNSGLTLGADGAPQTNATSNRLRGIGIPSASVNYYPSIGLIPVDTYNVQSIEISRGPNSMLFGMGSPAGVVNRNPTQAVLQKDGGRVSFRVDDRGSTRESISFNKVLVKGKLAIYGALLNNEEAFERKPSYDKTKREFAAVTFHPFKKTIIRGSFENYHNQADRPNSLTPIDGVTQWRLAGQPVYDPTTLLVTKMATGQVIGPYVMQATSPLLDRTRAYISSLPNFNPGLWNAAKTTYNGVNIFGTGALTNAASILYVPGITFQNARPTLQIANGQLQSWFNTNNGTYRNVYGTPGNPSANAPLLPSEATIFTNPGDTLAYTESWTGSSPWTATGGNVGSYRYPGVNDKSIYDWSKVNILQMNFSTSKNQTYNLELEQQLLSDLTLSAGWFREDFKSLSSYTVSQSNATALVVDTNLHRIDGSPNPFFGQPYVTDTGADRFINAELNDNYRALLAYTPDFTHEKGWIHWLGHHQLLGLFSTQRDMKALTRRHLYFTRGDEVANGTIRWLKNPYPNADGTATGWNYENTDQTRNYYLSTPGHQPYGTVTRASGPWNGSSFTGDVVTYNYEKHRWEGVNMTQDYIDSSATTGRSQRQVDSLSGGISSYLLNDRLVITAGLRRDEYKGRVTTNGIIVDKDGKQVAPAMTNQEKWVNGIYQTQTVFNRWNRWDELSGNTKTVGGVLRPFQDWPAIDSHVPGGALGREFVESLGFSYNTSDNFNPPPSAQVDGFGKPLPKPTGTGKDWGVQFSLFKSKLFARVNWFNSSNVDERTNANTAFSRFTSSDDGTFKSYARTIALINLGMDPTASGFGSNLTPATEDAVQAAASKIYGLPYTYYASLPGALGATRSANAKGTEVQVTYNPISNWTIKLTGAKTATTYTNVLKEFDALYAVRFPIWQAAKGANFLLPQYQKYVTYTASDGTPVNLTDFLTSYGYSGPKLGDTNGLDNFIKTYNVNVQSQYLISRDLQGQRSPEQREYRGSVLTNYAFDRGHLKGIAFGGSERWESKAILGYYGKPNTDNPNLLSISDLNRPIYDKGNSYTDVWASYSRHIFHDTIKMKIQLNVVNALESGGLQVVAVNFDGSPSAYRIVDPRQFILTTSFDF